MKSFEKSRSRLALILLAALLSVVPGIARGARKPQN